MALPNFSGRRHPNWRLAEAVLSEVLPGSTGFGPDEISGLFQNSWAPFEVDDRDPVEVSREFLSHCELLLAGVMVVVAFASYEHDTGPFFINSADFLEFWESYAETYGEYPFMGDLVIVSPATGRVLVVHHDGLIAELEGSPCVL